MPSVGERQRAAVVVGMVVAGLFLVANLPVARPAAAQGMTLPTTPTSVAVAPSNTTTGGSPSTTVPPSTTSARPRSTPTTAASPSTTARRVTPSTTTARTGTVAGSDDSPDTTEQEKSTADTFPPLRTTTTTTSDLALEPAASSTGLSTGSLVVLVVAGLLAVALALSLLTVRYVRATQPGDRRFD